jgi:hypothetical protein
MGAGYGVVSAHMPMRYFLARERLLAAYSLDRNLGSTPSTANALATTQEPNQANAGADACDTHTGAALPGRQ